MNTIWKSNLVGHLGTFEWYKPGTTEVQNLGPVLDVCVRLQVQPPYVDLTRITYVVEVLYSQQHVKGAKLDYKHAIAHLKVQLGDDARICLATFKADKFGQAYRLGLHEKVDQGYHSHSLTVNDWVWDNGCQPVVGE